jgi:phosphoserine phosphatase RsbU/P
MELKDKLLARDEIEVARQVQLALLPREHPRLPGWSIWSYMRPANDVGADLVDYIDLASRGLGIALGDVSGKGLGAALLTAKLQATLRALLPGHPSLAALGGELNSILHRDGLDNRFATLFFFEIQPGKGEVRYLNAGHNPPFVAREDRVEPLAASSLPLGMMGQVEYAEGRVSLEPGDVLLIYSDGVTEARNPEEEEFGEQRLRALLPLIRPLPADQAGLRILHEVNAFLAGERNHDDLSLIVALRV